MPMPSDPYVLLVEDDVDVREAVLDTLLDEGHHAVGLGDGSSALNHLRRAKPPCLILLDWNMAPMNGAEFLSEMQKDAELATLPVVVMTADSRTHDALTLQGLAGFLKKPVSLNDLFAIVDKYCA